MFNSKSQLTDYSKLQLTDYISLATIVATVGLSLAFLF
jgi:hypothetical protein